MESACAQHSNSLRNILCLSLKCKAKGLICVECQKSTHQEHYSISISDLIECLTQNESVNDVRSKLTKQVVQVEQESTSQFHALINNLVLAQKNFNSEVESLMKLYNFNKDRSTKMLARIGTFLNSLNEFQNNSERSTQLVEDVVNFLSLAVFETEKETFPTNLVNQINSMMVQSQTIGHFFEEHDTAIQNNCNKIEDAIKQLMWSEVDILQTLEVSRYEAQNKNIGNLQVLCAREKDFPKKFAIIEMKMKEFDNISDSVRECFELYDKERISIKLRDPHSFELVTSIPQNNQVIAEIIHTQKPKDTLGEQQESSNSLRIIGISGSTRCGKSTLCQQLSIALNADILHQDLFFDKEKIYRELNGNWEKEESVNWEEFQKYILKMVESQRRDGKTFLIIEGIQLFCQAWIRDLCEVKLFIEVDEMTMYARRMKTTAAPEHYFWEIIAPEYLNYKRKVDEYQKSVQDQSSSQGKQIVYLNGEIPISELCRSSLKTIYSL